MIGRTPRVGDWVRVTDTTRTTGLLSGKLSPGTRAVVTGRGLLSGNLTIRTADGGLGGARRARVRPDQVRVVKRGGGVERLNTRAEYRSAARMGAVAVIAIPATVASLLYLARGGSTDGLLVALLDGALKSAITMFEWVVNDPVRALPACLVLWLAWRLTFGGRS